MDIFKGKTVAEHTADVQAELSDGRNTFYCPVCTMIVSLTVHGFAPKHGSAQTGWNRKSCPLGGIRLR